ncbi:hypothetical protein FIA58_020130 [Flavobacterium jejuense]|uniref:Uncharacterized protein n=1 Tax=Flavobacterium jejuense TaxID=1544455 RepID=A0ABX0IYR8_9FLAO|nr:hypothetical protein [Flavobacterium jejuense]NHN27994.1 hypothetical protein [Flavobacterium jejuense]
MIDKISEELIRYVISNYLHLFNDQEIEIYNSILRSNKVDTLSEENYNLLLSKKPTLFNNLIKITKDDKKKFYNSIVERLIDDGKIFVNRCPYCGSLAATPNSQRARCGHHWRNPTQLS